MQIKSTKRIVATLLSVYFSTSALAQVPVGRIQQRPAAPAPSGDSGVVLNNKTFDIPFSVERTGAQPVEVQLFYSQDQGNTWKFFGRKPANETGFSFEAAGDGNFWFSTRTIDAQGVSYPSGPLSPQLRVVVDTSNPRVNAKASTDGNGQVFLDYLVADATPDESFRIEYMSDAIQRWVPVSVTGRPGRRSEDGALTGRISWRPETQWRHLYVRMIVQDKAGNQTVVNEQVEKPRVATSPSRLAGAPQQPYPGVPAHTISGRPAGTYAPAGQLPAHSARGPAQPNPNFPQLRQPGAGVTYRPPVPGSNVPYMAAQPYAHPNAGGSMFRGASTGVATHPASAPGLSLNGPAQASSGYAPQTTPNYPSAVPTTAQQLNSSPAVSSQQPVAARNAFHPIVPGSNAAELATSAQPTAHRPAVAPPAAVQTSNLHDTPRISRSRQFSLDYEVESIGNGGVEAVELWGTRDKGATWKLWNADPDKVSPFDIEVSRDGLIGFRIVVVAANGLTTPKPTSGEPADLYILVDTIAPKARLLGATYGRDAETGSLVIDYACSDDNFTKHPISLSFSDRPDGEWTTIATGLSNSGRYVWPADPTLPREIYLRVEAKDQAGNIGVHALDIPVGVEGLSPRGHIRGFEAIDGPAASQAQSQAPSARFR